MAIALLALALVLALLALRIKRLLDELSASVKQRVNPMLDQGGQLLEDLGRGAAQLEKNLTTAGRLLERVETAVSRLEPEALSRRIVSPLVATVVSWITGAKKAVSVLRERTEKKGGGQQ
jgi:hypothetical protein